MGRRGEREKKEGHKVEGNGISASKMGMNRKERCRQNETTAQVPIH